MCIIFMVFVQYICGWWNLRYIHKEIISIIFFHNCHMILDELNHAPMTAVGLFARLPKYIWKHNDSSDLERIWKKKHTPLKRNKIQGGTTAIPQCINSISIVCTSAWFLKFNNYFDNCVLFTHINWVEELDLRINCLRDSLVILCYPPQHQNRI